MDGLDLRIVRALGVQAWGETRGPADAARPAVMARRFRVRPELVRERIARMEAAGVIAGYEVYPNFRHLGLQATTLHYRLPEDAPKARALDEAAAFDGVFGVYGYLGDAVCVDVCHRSVADRTRRVDVLAKLMGQARPLVLWERVLPPVDRVLDELDWRIIQALRGDAHRPLDQVAQALDTSVRTTRRRYARLADEGSIDVIANFDPTRLEGHVMVEFHVRFARPSAAVHRAVLKTLDENWFTAWTPPDAGVGGLVAGLVGRSIGHFEELRDTVEQNEHVSAVHVLVPSRTVYDGTWIDEAIAEKVAATP